ncbi:hypothetical protein [Amycolatopsis minnesotensis]
MHDPDSGQWIVFSTAVPGTSSHEALKPLKVVGTRNLTTAD